ncbi:MAG: D-aminoacyl-tRNA deacylase [Candidatus Nanopelagicales bacterium]
MRAVVQRADGARVEVAGEVVGSFDGPGLVVLVGVTHDDTAEVARRLAAKVHDLRLFESARVRAADGHVPPDGPRELSASDLGLPLLVISQFTLYGQTRKGRRPTWDAAAPGDVAAPLVDEVVAELRRRGARVETGVFGADMRVSLTNDGPVTVSLEL